MKCKMTRYLYKDRSTGHEWYFYGEEPPAGIPTVKCTIVSMGKKWIVEETVTKGGWPVGRGWWPKGKRYRRYVWAKASALCLPKWAHGIVTDWPNPQAASRF